jgi:hypothetical protein
VRIYSAGKQLEQGAVEVAAIEKRQFAVVEYVTQAQIRAGGSRIEYFPPAFLPRIKQLADGEKD